MNDELSIAVLELELLLEQGGLDATTSASVASSLDACEAEAPFCPHCGALFDEGIRCVEHPDEEADGVCILSAPPCCSECGRWRNDRFLCGAHEDYELHEERARVYGSPDLLSAEYAAQCLTRAGLHPYTCAPPPHPPGSIEGIFSGEAKVLVPFSEVRETERVLRDLAVLPP